MRSASAWFESLRHAWGYCLRISLSLYSWAVMAQAPGTVEQRSFPTPPGEAGKWFAWLIEILDYYGLPHLPSIVFLILVALGLMVLIVWAVIKIRGETGRPVAATQRTPVDSPTPQLSASEQLHAYLNKLATESKALRLGGLSSEASDPQKAAAEQRNPLLLTEVFVSIEVDQFKVVPNNGKPEHEMYFGGRQAERLSAIQALSQPDAPCAVLLGQPGAGKTSLLRFLSFHLAQSYRSPQSLAENMPDWKAGAGLPVMVSLARLADALPTKETPEEKKEPGSQEKLSLNSTIRQFIEEELEASVDLKGFALQFWQQLGERGGVFFFDGLDEVAPNKRAILKSTINDFLATRTNWRAVVTCRTFSYGDPSWQLEGWPAYTLAPLSRELQQTFIKRWYDALIDKDPASKALYSGKAESLMRAVVEGDARQLREIATNPLILTLVTIIHTHREELPRSRVRIYEECVQLLLLRWQTRRNPNAPIRSILEELAQVVPEDKRAGLEGAFDARPVRRGLSCAAWRGY